MFFTLAQLYPLVSNRYKKKIGKLKWMKWIDVWNSSFRGSKIETLDHSSVDLYNLSSWLFMVRLTAHFTYWLRESHKSWCSVAALFVLGGGNEGTELNLEREVRSGGISSACVGEEDSRSISSSASLHSHSRWRDERAAQFPPPSWTSATSDNLPNVTRVGGSLRILLGWLVKGSSNLIYSLISK